MTEQEIIDLARKELDQGLCFSRTEHITRATDAELIRFARILESRVQNNAHGMAVEDYMLQHHPDVI